MNDVAARATAYLTAHGSGPAPDRVPLSSRLERVTAPFFLLQGVLPRGHLVGMLGHPNSGKTAAALDLVLRIGSGKALGMRAVARQRVVYVGAENPEEVLLRIKLWCLENDVAPDALDGWFELIDQPVNFGDPEVCKDFLRKYGDTQGGPLGVVVIDTFSANFFGEDENAAQDVMAWITCVRGEIMRPTGCTVLVLHHPPKGSSDLHNWRGSGSAKGAIDSTWAVANSDGTVTLTQGKKRSRPFPDLYWKLKTVAVPGLVDNFGEPVTAVVAVPATTPGLSLAVC